MVGNAWIGKAVVCLWQHACEGKAQREAIQLTIFKVWMMRFD